MEILKKEKKQLKEISELIKKNSLIKSDIVRDSELLSLMKYVNGVVHSRLWVELTTNSEFKEQKEILNKTEDYVEKVWLFTKKNIKSTLTKEELDYFKAVGILEGKEFCKGHITKHFVDLVDQGTQEILKQSSFINSSSQIPKEEKTEMNKQYKEFDEIIRKVHNKPIEEITLADLAKVSEKHSKINEKIKVILEKERIKINSKDILAKGQEIKNGNSNTSK